MSIVVDRSAIVVDRSAVQRFGCKRSNSFSKPKLNELDGGAIHYLGRSIACCHYL